MAFPTFRPVPINLPDPTTGMARGMSVINQGFDSFRTIGEDQQKAIQKGKDKKADKLVARLKQATDINALRRLGNLSETEQDAINMERFNEGYDARLDVLQQQANADRTYKLSRDQFDQDVADSAAMRKIQEEGNRISLMGVQERIDAREAQEELLRREGEVFQNVLGDIRNVQSVSEDARDTIQTNLNAAVESGQLTQAQADRIMSEEVGTQQEVARRIFDGESELYRLNGLRTVDGAFNRQVARAQLREASAGLGAGADRNAQALTDLYTVSMQTPEEEAEAKQKALLEKRAHEIKLKEMDQVIAQYRAGNGKKGSLSNKTYYEGINHKVNVKAISEREHEMLTNPKAFTKSNDLDLNLLGPITPRVLDRAHTKLAENAADRVDIMGIGFNEGPDDFQREIVKAQNYFATTHPDGAEARLAFAANSQNEIIEELKAENKRLREGKNSGNNTSSRRTRPQRERGPRNIPIRSAKKPTQETTPEQNRSVDLRKLNFPTYTNWQRQQIGLGKDSSLDEWQRQRRIKEDEYNLKNSIPR